MTEPAGGLPLVWILTGMSGSGKATALASLEAAGAECVDNLPIELVNGFAALPRTQVAVAVIDARQGARVAEFEGVVGARVLFLDARDSVLVHRIAESTRPHPCADRGRGAGAVTAERALLRQLRGAADVVIDSSELTPEQLQERVRDTVLPHDQRQTPAIRVTISSFGFKHGPQLDADWVVDARLMANPFWDPDLRALTGLDTPVRDFVLELQEAKDLIRHVHDTLRWSLPLYQDHRRRFLHVAIGCTGGRHRSVVVSEQLADELRRDDFAVTVHHRDVHRADPRD